MKRYALLADPIHGGEGMFKSTSGEYVRLEEVVALLNERADALEATQYSCDCDYLCEMNPIEQGEQEPPSYFLRSLARHLSDTTEADEHLVIDREGEIARYHPEPTKGEED